MAKRSIAQHILTRLRELGIGHVFGVPGDFNLLFLDHIAHDPQIQWVGTCNELNGAYAADGYARIKGIGALVTTYGVGELSAMNGIAGSSAEGVPVVHLVGMPASQVLKGHGLVHHSLSRGADLTFVKMSEPLAAASLVVDESTTSKEIDRVLEACWLHKQPVYIGIPSDLADREIEIEGTPLKLRGFVSDPAALQRAVTEICSLIRKAAHPLNLIDGRSNRFRLGSDLETWVTQTRIPFIVTYMGLGTIDPDHPLNLGVYSGQLSPPAVESAVAQSDCLLVFGPQYFDLNTGGFSFKLNSKVTIEINPHSVRIGENQIDAVSSEDLIPALLEKLQGYQNSSISITHESESPQAHEGPLTQGTFWQAIGKALPKHAIVVAETGTSVFGLVNVPLPSHCTMISQIVWGSIGYSVGALLGAQLAAPDRPCLLFVGDGSFQLTAQELSTILRHGLTPTVFLLNNQGYTTERLIHGPEMAYNDIAQWDYCALAKCFAGPSQTAVVKTHQELQAWLQAVHEDPASTQRLQFVEVVLPRMDAPESLVKLCKALQERDRGAG